MGKKQVNDKFYTKPEIAKMCTELLKLDDYDCVIEPSAGNGSFSNQIIHSNLISFDIEPENSNIVKQDWLQYSKYYKDRLLVCGNPPFGERNSLSKAFIKKSIEINAQTIAFILPNVYNKHTLQSIFPNNYRLKYVKELPKNSFILNNKEYHVPCSFYIWDKSNGLDLRFDIKKYKTEDFEFISKSKANDSVFFILGASPNTTKEISEVNKNNRGYYIQPKNKNKEELIRIFTNIKFKGMSSVNGGVSWLTKPEIIKNYLERE